MKLTGKKNTLDYIRSLETSTELADNIEKTMQETRKAKLREADAVSPLLMASLYSRRMQNIFRWF